MGRKMTSMLLLLRLLLPLLLAPATVRASKSNAVDESSMLAADAVDTRTQTDDWKFLGATWTKTTSIIAETTTTAAADREQSTRAPDDGLSEVDEGRRLMERFYRRYSKTAQVDLVFVLDRSGSVPQKGWRSIVEFVKVGIIYGLSNILMRRTGNFLFPKKHR